MQDEPIKCDEAIGRGVFSKSLAERLRSGASPPWKQVRSLLTPRTGENSVSADRLDGADRLALTKFHDAKAAKRAQTSEFHGWFCCKACVFKTLGGTVRASGTTENPNHCDVSVVLQDRKRVLEFLSSIPMEQRWEKRCDSRRDPLRQ